jgi:DNA-directed RNA polymerase subunit RPC12/RpoP
MQEYTQPLAGIPACDRCGNAILLISEGGYTCDHCGFNKPSQKKKAAGCLCWLSKDICPRHALR